MTDWLETLTNLPYGPWLAEILNGTLTQGLNWTLSPDYSTVWWESRITNRVYIELCHDRDKNALGICLMNTTMMGTEYAEVSHYIEGWENSTEVYRTLRIMTFVHECRGKLAGILPYDETGS